MSKAPVVRPISWINASIALAILGLFVATGYAAAGVDGVIPAVAVYLLTSLLLRTVIASHHRKAIRLCKRQQFALAIPEFQRSADFFARRAWVDRWRAITMLSAAAMRYREMALVSLGFCYAQVGDGWNARQSYEQCLREYPDNGMAQAALRLMDAGSSNRGSG